MRFGLNCSADSAAAHLGHASLLSCPLAHADRLIASFGDIGRLIHEPLDIVAAIDNVEPFRPLNATAEAAPGPVLRMGVCARATEHHDAGPPRTQLRLVAPGRQGLITAFDNYGRERPRSRLDAGNGYGKTSLFEGKQRDATVRAVRGRIVRGLPGLPGADILTWTVAISSMRSARSRRLWGGEELVRRIPRRRRRLSRVSRGCRRAKASSGRGGPHILWLLWPLGLVGILLLALVGLAVAAPQRRGECCAAFSSRRSSWRRSPSSWPLTTTMTITCDEPRVTRRDRQLLLFESRAEAPVEMIQDVTIERISGARFSITAR